MSSMRAILCLDLKLLFASSPGIFSAWNARFNFVRNLLFYDLFDPVCCRVARVASSIFCDAVLRFRCSRLGRPISLASTLPDGARTQELG